MKKWKWVKKIPWVKMIVGFLAIGLVLFVMDGMNKKPSISSDPIEDQVQSVVVKPVIKSKLLINKTYLGYIEDSAVYIGADRVQGRIGELMVAENDEVTLGSVLFTLDISSDLVSSEIQLKEIELGKSTLDLQINQLLPDFERLEELYSEGIVALSELEQVQNQLKSLELQRYQLDQQYQQLINTLSVAKEQAKVLSPIDGTVEKITIVPGTYIGQQDMIEVRKIDLPTCFVMVAESEIDGFVIGEKVKSSVGGSDYEGTIKSVKKRDEQQLLFPVEIELNTTDHLLAGRTVKVMVEDYSNPSAMMIHHSSLIAFAGETYVYILNEDDTVSKREVQVGGSQEQMVEVLKGLSYTNQVVVEGQFSISEGEKVTWIKQ